MFEKTIPILIVFIVGYLLKKKNVLEKKDSKIFGKLLINLVIPAVIITAFSAVKIERDLIYLPLSGFVIVFSLSAISYVLARIMKLERKTMGAFMTLFPTFEGGIIGYTFMLSAFGELGLSRIVLFDIANAVFVFTVAYFIAVRFGNEKALPKDALINVIKAPIIWAIFIGLFLNIAGIENALFSNTLDIIGKSMLLLAMLMLGLEFEPKASSFKLPAITVLLKTSIGFALGWIISAIFGFSGIEKIAVLVWSSLPASVATLIFSEENNLDTNYVANMFSIALPFALIYLTILLNFL